jgi:preprotein translocase subunit SecB
LPGCVVQRTPYKSDMIDSLFNFPILSKKINDKVSIPMKNQDQVPKSSTFHFDNVFTYLNSIDVKHINPPAFLLNKDTFSNIKDKSKTDIEISTSAIGGNMFKTIFYVEIKASLHGLDKMLLEEKNYDIYEIKMIFESFTLINDAKEISEIDINKILMVDVANLMFPFIENQVGLIINSMKANPVQLHRPDFNELFMYQAKSAINCL